MKWEEFLKMAGNQAFIEMAMLAKSSEDLPKLKVQLSRWVKSGRLLRVRQGIYILSSIYRKAALNYDLLAVSICRPAYISLEYALASYGMIPEAVNAITLVTTKRPHEVMALEKPIVFKHVSKKLFWGYESRGKNSELTFYATPEKALLDLFYLTSGRITAAFLKELRLQNTEVLDIGKLKSFADRFASPKILQAAKEVERYVKEQKGWEEL